MVISVSVATQTDPPPTLSTVSVATDDIELMAALHHDHAYSRRRTPPPVTPETLTTEEAMSVVTDSDDEDHDITDHPDDDDDSDYDPNQDDSSSDDEEENELPSKSVHTAFSLFVVFLTNLMELFNLCHHHGCGKPLVQEPELRVSGFALTVATICTEGHHYRWESQQRIGDLYAGNLLIPSAVFIMGGSFTTFLEICKLVRLACLSIRECNNIQRCFLIPEVKLMWSNHLKSVLGAIGNKPLQLSGDGRCDSPGHCATYGTYTLLDSTSHLIVAQKTVRVTDVKNSYWLEVTGLKQCINGLTENGCNVETLATDRHPSITKIMRENYADVDHQYDLWHIVKGIKKQLLAAKKPLLTQWVRSIANHLYYCAMTSEGNGEILVEKWLSILHHITNEHRWVTGNHITKCDHPEYSLEEQAKTKWLSKISSDFKILQDVVMNKKLLKDLPKVVFCLNKSISHRSIYSILYTKNAAFTISLCTEFFFSGNKVHPDWRA